MAGDSLIDDESSVNHFMEWVKSMTGNNSPSPADGETVSKDTKAPAFGPQEHDTSDVSSAAASALLVAPSQKHEDERKSIEEIAHLDNRGYSRKLPTPNKLDCSLENEPTRSLSSMTSTQRKLFQKLEPKRFEEHRNSLPNPFEKQHIPERRPEAAISESLRQDMGTAPVLKVESTSQEGNIEPVGSKKQRLVDSIHARPTIRGLQSRTLYGRQHQEYPLTKPDLISPVRVIDGGNHDTMEYFETKRKEYYPSPILSSSSSKLILQSRDPNRSMRSPKKPAAKEFSAVTLNDKVVNKAVEVHNEGVPLGSVNREEEVGPVLAAIDSKDEPAATVDSRPRTTEDMIDQQEATEAARDPSVTDDVDLTPVLNVLSARIIGEKNESTIDSVAQVPTETVSRTLVVRNLPDNSDYTLVQSVIKGASIMSMKLMQEKNCAQVKLTDTGECLKFVESCQNGTDIKHNGRKHTVFVELLPEVGEDDELLEVYLDCGATRAVQAGGVDLDLTMRTLYQLAAGPTSSREVEGINDSFSAGIRKVMFRFASIQDAVAFRSSLRRDVDWKTKNIEFVRDPCA